MKNLLAFLLAAVLIVSGPPAARAEKSTPGEEFVIGEEIHQTIVSSFPPYTEPKAVGYISKVGSSLAEYADRRELSYRFTILYNDQIYASSSPGGRVYITTGMIYFLQNEAELAAVLAHEIGELQYKNPKASSMRKRINRVTETGAMVAPAFGPLGALVSLGFVGIHMISKSSEKTTDERVILADRRALDYMAKAGYDPQGMIDVFYRFASVNKEALPYFMDYYQSRPLTVDRTQAMQKQFKKLNLEDKTFQVRREQYLEMTRGIRDIYKA